MPKLVDPDLPLILVFRALGLKGDRQVLEYVVYKTEGEHKDHEMMNILKPSLEVTTIHSSEDALNYLGTRSILATRGINTTQIKRLSFAKEVLSCCFFPHLGVTSINHKEKAFFLGYVTHILLSVVLGRRKEDDMEHIANKRLESAGTLLARLFRSLLSDLRKDIAKKAQKLVDQGELIDFKKCIDDKKITSGLRYSLSTGNWVKQGTTAPPQPGVAQVLQRLTYASTLSHLRRVNLDVGKSTRPRQLHSTHWGVICPSETPEGQTCGLIKNLALMTFISIGCNSSIVRNALDTLNVKTLSNLTSRHLSQMSNRNDFQIKTHKIFLNGVWYGIYGDAEKIVNMIREVKNMRICNQNMYHKPDSEDLLLCFMELGIVHDIVYGEIHIYTDWGRCMRPLFVVDKELQRLKIRKKHLNNLDTTKVSDSKHCWLNFLWLGLLEYVGVEEEETAMIAMSLEDLNKAKMSLDVFETEDPYCTSYTHCEIHPSMMFGVAACMIPFSDHNQSPRNTYQSAMGKQSVGIYALNFRFRMDTNGLVLYYPQKPLATPQSAQYLNLRELPTGINAIVAIACYSGYNQEDSILMNQSSFERGLFRSISFRTYKSEEQAVSAHIRENFERPDRNAVGSKNLNYENLDDDGLAPPGSKIHTGDVIIGKTVCAFSKTVYNTFHFKKDTSIQSRLTETAVVDRVLLTTNDKGERFVQTRVRCVSIPQIGDKFASRHGQKGVCGATYTQEDMPFSREGIVPDLIINPHAIPSRMTIGHLIECLVAKVASLSGISGDSTPFSDMTVNEITDKLHNLGYQKHGWEVMFNGHTGQPLPNMIFIGPTYYQRLKHMVADKIYSRSSGKVTNLTRQPLEGRAREGGLRFGEMERDCIISHGAASFLRERLLLASDVYRLHICEGCGTTAVADFENKSFFCRVCTKRPHTTNGYLAPMDNRYRTPEIIQIMIPYATKLLFQELMSMIILPKIIF
eukprot:gnl/MRDRNA2_/MRDRNA2_86586_c0_seq2.p1 gnl/MRDRNA2_/MRDRNA2_86586_c0~~gnl/MRDRNA2_/MRDRNA2_86586_c0_seq2.p1  ORF type:complete len:969 (+),score=-1.87 gnl/MRDRNA2_/MRDRNA2_86586_c0_seq2:233-3139(+)